MKIKNKLPVMMSSRRRFLKNTALASLASSSIYSLATGFNVAQAQVDSPSDYRALVCIFLLGGNDAFNMLIPRSPDEYTTYANTRLSLAVNRDELLAINPVTANNGEFGLHPNMMEVQSLFNSGNLAFVGNVGALIQPTTQADVLAGRVELPPQLFSHNDQQNFVMSVQASRQQQGWASRIADMLLDINGDSIVPLNITLTGENTWQSGGAMRPYALGSQGVTSLLGLDVNDPGELAVARRRVFQQLLGRDSEHLFVREYANVQTRSINIGAEVATALNNLSPLATPFNDESRLGASLRQVAQLIAQRESLGMRRQMFFIGIGDYDTHGDQASRHPLLMQELSESLGSFYQATQELGVADLVTTFTASEFGRTLTTNGDGTDHGWGSHQIVMGGAVAGGDIYGTMPDLAIGSRDDFGEGRIIPTTSIEQYAATLCQWYGLSSSSLVEVFPNLARFNQQNLGFFS